MIKVGIIGLSEGNGHPYSFSAIINGYNAEEMQKSDWPNIHAYLQARDPSDFGIDHLKVTHVWTQDLEESSKIARASKIDHVVTGFTDMLPHIDAVIIARDDYHSHRVLSEPFLEAGKTVFIDKPLSLDPFDWEFFTPYLRTGQLMSTSGIRYAPELDTIKRDFTTLGPLNLMRGTVVKSWEKYAIHMLEALDAITPLKVTSIRHIQAPHESFALSTAEGTLIQIDALGDSPLSLRVELYGQLGIARADTLDAFVAFRRTLAHFGHMIHTKTPPINPEQTLHLMHILAAGVRSRNENREVFINEVIL